MKILIINGPNLNLLGIREKSIYGDQSFDDYFKALQEAYPEIELQYFQSNHEGDLVDYIQQAYGVDDAIVINPGAYTHTSVAILDAAKAVGLPVVEVHISKVEDREDFRQISYIRQACVKTITGHGIAGYTEAIDYLKENYGA